MTDAIEPVPVKHVSGDFEQEVFRGVSKAFSPDVSVAQTVTLPASSLLPVPILPLDPRRFKATLINSGTTGVAIVGTKGQVSNGVGGQLAVSNKLEIYSGQAYFAVAQGSTAAQLTVLIETFSQAESEVA
jgi:hypothetical protein